MSHNKILPGLNSDSDYICLGISGVSGVSDEVVFPSQKES